MRPETARHSISSSATKAFVLLSLVILFSTASAQPRGRSSLVEDRAAKKLLEAGDARYESDELKQAVEVWQSVIERYPRSRVRFEAHMRLGNYFLERERSYDRARVQFNSVVADENPDERQRADATLKMGVCFYEARNFGKSFQVMRDVIEKFPTGEQVNQAYYYIGLGHFQLGHYRRAIDALEKVGTALAEDEGKIEKVEAGKRLFVKIDDADLAALGPGEMIRVRCSVAGGDVETVDCYSVGRNVRLVLGTIPTRLGRPAAGNGQLEVKGDDRVTVTYVDRQTADKKFDQEVLCEVTVVGDAVVRITDGAYASSLRGVVLGKPVNIEISDPDLDVSDGGDMLSALVEVYRAKTDEELEAETLATVSNAEGGANTNSEESKIDRFKQVDQLTIQLTEAKIERQLPAFSTEDEDVASPAKSAPDESGSIESAQFADDSIHTGVFRSAVSLVKSEEIDRQDALLQAMPGDMVRVTYLDRRNSGEGVRNVQYQARSIEGSLGGVRV
ncbi:MAG: tetratricopeptide repeat protein, partial [Planctomycetota bacterium]